MAPILQNHSQRHRDRSSNPERTQPQLPNPMLSWTLTFIIVAIIAGILGFGGIAGAASGVAQVCFFIFLVLFVVSLIRGKKPV